ncbi:MAG: ribose-phosphate pyrophosphokinase [Myxococcota bacterium]
MHGLKLLSGTSNPQLSREISTLLDVDLTPTNVRRFSDGELYCEFAENIRGEDVYIVQSTCTPVNDNIMELLIMLDAARRASAGSVTAVIPYYGYGRQDRKVTPRSPITAKLVADILATAGANRVIAMDLHASQIQAFFNVPFDHLYALPVLNEDMKARFGNKEVVIVSPDAGGVERARAYAKHLDNAKIAIIDKRRPEANVAEIMHIIGDVKGKIAVLLDDMIDTAGTITNAASALQREGATEVYAYCTHPVLSGKAVERLKASPLKAVICSNTIPLSPEAKAIGKIEQLSVAMLLAKAISRIHKGESLSALFSVT